VRPAARTTGHGDLAVDRNWCWFRNLPEPAQLPGHLANSLAGSITVIGHQARLRLLQVAFSNRQFRTDTEARMAAD
jgi:hypothetical protein